MDVVSEPSVLVDRSGHTSVLECEEETTSEERKSLALSGSHYLRQRA